MVDRICPAELRLNGGNSSDAGAPFLDLNLCISNGTVFTKVCDGRDDFGFGVVGFPFLDSGVPWRASFGVCMSQLVGFAGASSGLGDFDCRNGALAAGLRQGCRYFGRFRGAFSGFCRGHGAFLEGCSVSLGDFCGRVCRSRSFTVTRCAGVGRL